MNWRSLIHSANAIDQQAMQLVACGWRSERPNGTRTHREREPTHSRLTVGSSSSTGPRDLRPARPLCAAHALPHSPHTRASCRREGSARANHKRRPSWPRASQPPHPTALSALLPPLPPPIDRPAPILLLPQPPLRNLFTFLVASPAPHTLHACHAGFASHHPTRDAPARFPGPSAR